MLTLYAQDLEAHGIDEEALRRCAGDVLAAEALAQVVQFLSEVDSALDPSRPIRVHAPAAVHAYQLVQA